MLYLTGDSKPTQNIQINKIIGENEKCVFYFVEKSKWTFWLTCYFYTPGEDSVYGSSRKVIYKAAQ